MAFPVTLLMFKHWPRMQENDFSQHCRCTSSLRGSHIGLGLGEGAYLTCIVSGLPTQNPIPWVVGSGTCVFVKLCKCVQGG